MIIGSSTGALVLVASLVCFAVVVRKQGGAAKRRKVQVVRLRLQCGGGDAGGAGEGTGGEGEEGVGGAKKKITISPH